MRSIIGGLCLSALLVLGGYWIHMQEAQVAFHPDNLIRLHVIANSDLAVDQQLKHEVRDEILAKLGPYVAEAGTVQEVRAVLQDRMDYIHRLAEHRLREAGCEDPVRVEYGVFPFPVKGYGSLVLPAGEYEAVKVIIGEGEGSNWWCVLFPPLCFVDIAQGELEETSAEELLRQVKGGDKQAATPWPHFKFKTAELLRQVKLPF
ncbi:MAG TPA: stage II sporulation protein R [Clostridia bacterium]|nr:stage II sporulation protein R [Clostridia bacterium]